MGESNDVTREVKRQTVILIFGTVGTLIAAYIMYLQFDPTARKTLRMSAALKVKRFASAQVDWWQNIADQAANIYNQEKL